jgi:hypothetical protein
MAKENTPASSGTPGFVLYEAPDGRSRLSVRLEGKTVWLTQAQMAELFQSTKQNISLHVQNVLEEGELPEESVVKEYLTTAADGKSYATKHYSLDMIIAVGYRVRSARGTQFRQWATATLAEYLSKGFALDDTRLKEAKNWGADYFDELLARIRDIRASERRFYQKITDIYATSIDYDSKAAITQEFYAIVQNKLHWAITGHTAAETVVSRADATKPNMGLTTWKNAPTGPVRKGDVGVAKNYLSEKEIAALNRIVTMYLDYAEDQAARQIPMHMADWVKKLDAFLTFNERNILTNAGKVSAAMAEDHAAREFEKFDKARLEREAAEPTSDFDKIVERTRKLKPASDPKPDNVTKPTKKTKKKGK